MINKRKPAVFKRAEVHRHGVLILGASWDVSKTSGINPKQTYALIEERSDGTLDSE